MTRPLFWYRSRYWTQESTIDRTGLTQQSFIVVFVQDPQYESRVDAVDPIRLKKDNGQTKPAIAASSALCPSGSLFVDITFRLDKASPVFLLFFVFVLMILTSLSAFLRFALRSRVIRF